MERDYMGPGSKADEAYEVVFRGPMADQVIEDLKRHCKWYTESIIEPGQPDVTAERLGRRALLVYILKKSGRLHDAE